MDLKSQTLQQQTYQISNELAQKLSELLQHLDIEYKDYRDTYMFRCPIHGGDNVTGCSILKQNGSWSCWTHECHNEFKKSTFGFVRGVLSHRASRKVTMNETMDFCLKFLNKESIDLIETKQTTRLDLKLLDIFDKKIVREKSNFTREYIRSSLETPSNYYINRGFSSAILDKFDVGNCIQPNKPMSNRVVVPVYDEEDTYVGCVGRSIVNNSAFPKWINSKGFSKSSFLYGLNFAKEHIIKKGTVYIVEGQGDVWRLHEAGYENSVGIFGANLSDEQLILLESSGCLNVVILTDTDTAGEKAVQQIIKKCGRRFNYFRPSISKKDIGDMTIEEVKSLLGDLNV